MSREGTIFDDVFRTLLEKLPQLAIPLINEVFHTAYDEKSEITQLRNEHRNEDTSRTTDSCLLIGDKMYHIECQSSPDSTMVIRMAEYDFFIALEYVKGERGKYRMEFPRSCVLYLRHNSNTEDKLDIEVHVSDGVDFTYSVPVIKVQDYTKDMIFQKKLLFLLPFYVLRYEKEAGQIEEDEEKIKELLTEYEEIRDKILVSFGEGNHGREYAELVELITRISDYIFRKQERLRKGVNGKMRGKVLELEVDKAIDKAVSKAVSKAASKAANKAFIQGISHGTLRGRIEAYYDVGLTPEKIAEKMKISQEEVEKTLKEIGVLLV